MTLNSHVLYGKRSVELTRLVRNYKRRIQLTTCGCAESIIRRDSPVERMPLHPLSLSAFRLPAEL